MPIPSEIYKLESPSVVQLFELTGYNNADIFRFTNELTCTWQGNVYQQIPCQVEGFEYTTSGTLPRPKITVSNIDYVVTQLIQDYNELIGAKLTRKRTLAKYLDGQPFADNTQQFNDDIWFVDRKVGENDESIQWELVSSLDLEGLRLPKRVVISNICGWLLSSGYRGADCGYTGAPVATKNDVATSDPLLDKCGGRIASCKLRWGVNGELPIGSFPAASRY